MKLQVSPRQRSTARIRDSGARNRDLEEVRPDSRLTVVARLVHREAVAVDVIHTRAAGEGHAGALADRLERVDRQAVHPQALGMVGVLELAVQPAASPRARVESEG